MMSPALGVPLGVILESRIRHFSPDLVLGIGPFHWLPRPVFEMVRAIPGRPPVIAWVGDTFGEEAAAVANLFDVVAYTDTGLQARHNQFGFRSTSAYVPLAAVRSTRSRLVAERDRIPSLAFVASESAQRRRLLAQIAEPIALFGPDWRRAEGLEHHGRDGRRINQTQLSHVYRSYMGSLNISNELNVINGLNQRHFAPYVEGAFVVTDMMADIERCFDLKTEILSYWDADELSATQDELRRYPSKGRAIANAGRRRVLANHTYANRLDTLAELVGIGSRC